MRGRRGRGGHPPQPPPPSSSSSVTQEKRRMALRKQKIIDIPSESQQMEEDSQEDEAADDQDELSSSLLATSSARGKRHKEGEDKSKPKEMTEEEMMDLALRLSEQEASVTALRRQQEEEAVMKAIEESMVGQTQPCWTSQSPSQPAHAPLRLFSRRKLAYSNGKKNPDVDRGASEDSCTPAGTGDDDNRNVKKKRKAGSPLPEMPDLSQTQNVYSQPSPCSSESPLALPGSPQSSDSTQIEDSQLRRSPVFPPSGCRAEVRIDRLSQDLLDTCRSAGFVLCTQDSLNSTQKSTRPRSPTFPESNLASRPKSPVLSGVDPNDSDEIEPSPECVKSPAFGRETPHEQTVCKPRDSACSQGHENSGFTFSSQESLTPSVRAASPVFPRSPSIPASERLAFPKSPDRGQTKPSHTCSVSPVFGLQKKSESPPAAEHRDPSGNRMDGRSRVDEFKASESEEPRRWSKSPNRAETEPTSDMMLVWTDEDEDDDVTPTGSPSPVFPEETSIHHAESPAASLNHVAPSGTTGPKCSLNPQRCVKDQSSSYKHTSSETSPKSSGGEHPSTTEQELQPAGSDSWTGPQSGEPAGSTTVHYYWGVPFCPRGLDPDTYTQVIVAQMEVYEKSLKRAQRCLLRKAEWGEAVLPQTEKSSSHESPAESPQHHGPRRRGLRLRSKSQSEAADAPTAEEEEEEGKMDEEEQRKMENKEEEEKDKGDKEQMDAEECQVCPETPPSDNDNSQDLMLVSEAEARPEAKSPEFPELQMILHKDPPARNESQVEEEAEGATGEKMEGDVPISSSDCGGEEVKEDSRGPGVKEIKGRGPQRAASPEEEPAIIPRSPETTVDCPICQASFPASKIEMHAAYCDGEVAVVDERRPEVDCIQVSLKPRRKRTRRANAEETNDHSNIGRNQEKCYICQKDVPLKDYSRHTELCIQRQESKTAAIRQSRRDRQGRYRQEGKSAAGTGSDREQGLRDVIDLRDDDDDDEEEEVSAFRVSNSPIRSFTSISEATDCLIDFKKQQRAKRPCQRRR
ncbi:BRCA1-A complex subunit RAP80 isoform X4 [Archocentrus centrarchus]|uniref:BRCA1-A complex subunit RAP80 isoform X4 n=1 Tax=Archocentrus centrarchus TaxID=63155 RepID=UPI0011EA3026|nr:BRCA1-A complex subunit RAP80 isoform X4 [Archocentrus centrarchus]XP_030601509.1 BRCA1-A complex subunit RAP80 isoform X4 [Archocentrus centrarchus]